MTDSILRLPTVKARTGLGRSTIYLRVAEGSFPRPISLGGRSIGFVESEIDAWIAGRIRASRKTAVQGAEVITKSLAEAG